MGGTPHRRVCRPSALEYMSGSVTIWLAAGSRCRRHWIRARPGQPAKLFCRSRSAGALHQARQIQSLPRIGRKVVSRIPAMQRRGPFSMRRDPASVGTVSRLQQQPGQDRSALRVLRRVRGSTYARHLTAGARKSRHHGPIGKRPVDRPRGMVQHPIRFSDNRNRHPEQVAVRAAISERSTSFERFGFALPVALLALLLIAALIAGAFTAVTEETRIGVAAADRQHAFLSAESAIGIVISALSASPSDSIAVGETRSRQIDVLEVPVIVYSTRLDSSLYWLVAVAGDTSSHSGIARRIGVVVRVANGPAGSISINRIPERGWSELF